MRPKCDQCQEVAINGVNCHEIGCPNMKKRWAAGSETWRAVYECTNCGCENYVGDPCCEGEEFFNDVD